MGETQNQAFDLAFEVRLWLGVIACNWGNLGRRLFGATVRRLEAPTLPAG